MNIFNLFKKPKGQVPLPNRKFIKPDGILKASALIVYGSPGNRATELVGSRLYKHRYTPVPFHAALYLDKGMFLNVGKFKELHELESLFLNTRRVDVIEYKLTDEQRAAIVDAGNKDTSKPKIGIVFPDYSISDFLRFGFRFLKPSKKDFCSENVVENMEVGGFHPSDTKAVDTAPWDLVEWAEDNPSLCTISTVWEGDTFKQKLGR